MKKLFLLLLPVLCFLSARSQMENTNPFSTFASVQDSLFHNAYIKRDTGTYQNLLKDFLARYKALDNADQKVYRGNCINAYYNLACIYSLVNLKHKALNLLSLSIKSGYNNYQHILEDHDLDNIRQQPAFTKLLHPLRETGDFLYIIRRAAAYNPNDKRDYPAFTYQSATDPNLVILRKTSNLDSIAGTGTETSKILNLMHWIHNLVPHDGNHENPVVKNALRMIAICKRDNRGLNCRGLATVLNECYLALGIRSRMVTCLPKDSLGTDNDCHVINMVYCNECNKWLWMDPTFDCYVMNEKGELLGIEEVRDRIIHKKMLIISPDANWNHLVSETKDYYLYYYMAKNLYLLECPVNSEYDLETRAPGKKISYIRLLPIDYFNQSPDKTESTDKKGQFTIVKYNSNNPSLFWQTPESKN
jgi:Transglutaminase-like superfamily